MSYKIDTIKCTFENPELEQKYLDDKWTKVSSFYFKVIIFFVSASALYLISLFLRDTIAIKTIINPIVFITFPLFLIFKNEDFKKKMGLKTRSCGDCTLCCKLPPVPALKKEANEWE